MSLNSVLEMGKSGLNIYQLATQVTSQNISNVNTAGYSRQQVVLETAPSTTANGFSLGTGVRIAAITRSYDALLQQQLVNAHTTEGYDTAKYNVLQQIEPSFNEVTTDGLGAAISNFFGAWQDLTLNAAGTSERQAVLTYGKTLADNFHSMSTTLNNTISTQNTSVATQITSINSTLANIAQLNGQIKTTEMVSGSANELKDQRDQLIQDLSTKMGVKYTENADGTTDVYVTDNSASPVADYYLVKGQNAGTVNANTTNPAKTVVTVTDATSGATSNAMDPTATTPFYTSDTSGGQLWATLKLRDVTIPGYLSQLDTLASTITSVVNTQHALGADLSGTTGLTFFDAAATSAATFGISSDIASTGNIAAAASGAASGDSSNAKLMAGLQNKLTMSGSSATFNGYYDGLVSAVGLDVQSSKTTVAQDTAYTSQLTTLQQSNSGVSLDEEMVNLVKYQRSYQASSKLITTATAMMDTVLGLI